jgi:Second Messenger Oligonucleotide or Dinucleotide Synthetase domain
MATTAIQAFEQFKARNALTSAQRAAIRERRDRIRRYLAGDGWKIETAIFGGSHGRGTKVRLPNNAKSDVDIYIVLDRQHKSAYGGVFTPPPKQLLSDIKASLDKVLTTPAIRADSPAVRIRYRDMDVDVVPAFRRLLGGFHIPYYDSWMLATPVAQANAFSKVNRATGYRAVHLVRMLKYWQRMHAGFPLRSYHLELIAYEILKTATIKDYRHAMWALFHHGSKSAHKTYWDPGGSGSSVSAYATRAMKNTAAQMLAQAAERARAAIAHNSWEGEINRWRSPQMFGSRFPAFTA